MERENHDYQRQRQARRRPDGGIALEQPPLVGDTGVVPAPWPTSTGPTTTTASTASTATPKESSGASYVVVTAELSAETTTASTATTASAASTGVEDGPAHHGHQQLRHQEQDRQLVLRERNVIQINMRKSLLAYTEFNKKINTRNNTCNRKIQTVQV